MLHYIAKWKHKLTKLWSLKVIETGMLTRDKIRETSYHITSYLFD